MAGGEAQLAVHPQAPGLGLAALELDSVAGIIPLDAIQFFQKIQMPESPAKFAIGGRLKSEALLLRHQFFDSGVFDFFKIRGRDLAALPFRTSFQQVRGAKKTADMVGAERRRGTSHELLRTAP